MLTPYDVDPTEKKKSVKILLKTWLMACIPLLQHKRIGYDSQIQEENTSREVYAEGSVSPHISGP